MSWKVYVDDHLIKTKKITEGAIIGLSGGIWANSPGIELSPEEQKAIVNGFSDPDQVLLNGIRAGGVKYFALQADGRSIYGKQGLNGIILVKTNLAVLVCIYKAPIQAGEATPVAEGLADYLIGLNY